MNLFLARGFARFSLVILKKMHQFRERIDLDKGGGWIQAQTPGARDIIVFDESAPRIGKAGGRAHFDFCIVDPNDVGAKCETSQLLAQEPMT